MVSIRQSQIDFTANQKLEYFDRTQKSDDGDQRGRIPEDWAETSQRLLKCEFVEGKSRKVSPETIDIVFLDCCEQVAFGNLHRRLSTVRLFNGRRSALRRQSVQKVITQGSDEELLMMMKALTGSPRCNAAA
jgi:hypothetical protein